MPVTHIAIVEAINTKVNCYTLYSTTLCTAYNTLL